MQNNLPEISVIIPVYNSDQFIEKCLQSLLRQKMENFEIIIVNDGSTDRSGQICDFFSKIDARVFVYHQKNRGVSASRNFGLQHAKGKWITFVDSDDFLNESFLINFTQNMVPEAELLIQGMKRFGTTESIFYDFKKNAIISVGSFMNNYPLLPYFFGPVSKLYSTELIKRENLMFDIGCSYGEDTLFNLDYISHCKQILLVKGSNYYYRYTSNSLSTKILSFKERKILFESVKHKLEKVTQNKNHLYWYGVELMKSIYQDRTVKNSYLILKDLLKNHHNVISMIYREDIVVIKVVRFLIKFRCYKLLDLLFKRIYTK